MRVVAFVIAGGLAVAGPAAAQFTAHYEGVDRFSGKPVPATATFSLEKGRAAMVMTGSHGGRMLFLQSDGVLRMVDDGGKQYYDVGKGGAGGMAEEMEAQLAQLPPEQREMAKKMMQGGVPGGGAKRSEPVYRWTRNTQIVFGHECTQVESMQDGKKRSEYWGSKSPDFRMSADERGTMLEMQNYLRNFTLMAQSADGGDARAFQWDTSVEGFPLITRCFADTTTTLDLKLVSFDRKALSDDLFKLPSDYKKMEMDMGEKPEKRAKPEKLRKGR